MCQASVYLDEKKVMDDVIWMEPTEDGVVVLRFFEEPQEVKGTLKGVDLLKHRILLVTDESKPSTMVEQSAAAQT